MTFKFSGHKWRNIIFLMLMAFVVLVTVPLLFMNSYLKPKLTAQLKAAVLKASDGLYRIDFNKAELHVLQGKLILRDITLIPDTAVYHQMDKKGIAPSELYELRVKELLLTGAHSFRLYFHKQLDVATITLDNPDIIISKYNHQEDVMMKDKRTIYQKLSKSLNCIHVKGISFNGIHLTYKNYLGDKPAFTTLKEMNIKLTELLIDSATQSDSSRTLFCKDIVTDLHHFKMNTADGLYQFKVRSVLLSTRTARLTVTGGEMVPLPSKVFFEKTKKLDRFTLRIDSVALGHFDFQLYRKTKGMNVGHMLINNAFYEVYTNPNRPPKKGDRMSTYPNYVIRHLQTALNVDTLDFKNINVVLTMFNKKSANPGSVKFIHTTGRILNITNNPRLIAKNNISKAKLTTYLMGKGMLNLAFQFNLSDPAYGFSYQGHLSPMNLQDGNVAIMPLGLVKVASGNVKSLDFNIRSTKNTSKGKVTFLYDDLKVALLRHDPEKGYTKRSLISLVANLIVLKKGNPDDGSTSARSGNVVYVRPQNSPFFETVWLTVLTGVKPCAGVGKAGEPLVKPLTEKEQKAQARALKKAYKKAAKAEKKFS